MSKRPVAIKRIVFYSDGSAELAVAFREQLLELIVQFIYGSI
jgi:hypothetical protein